MPFSKNLVLSVFLFSLLSCTPTIYLPPEALNIPKHKAKGTIAGQPFNMDYAMIYKTGVLNLREGQEFIPMREIIITFPIKDGESISGKNIRMSHKTPFLGFIVPQPTVTFKWQADTGLKRRAFAKDYVLNIELSEIQDGALDGKIYFHATWDHDDKIAGRFRAVLE